MKLVNAGAVLVCLPSSASSSSESAATSAAAEGVARVDRRLDAYSRPRIVARKDMQYTSVHEC
jgi:hypothetical protein